MNQKQYTITLTKFALAEISRQLQINPQQMLYCPAGLSELPGKTEFLVRSVQTEAIIRPPFNHRVILVGCSSRRDLEGRFVAALRNNQLAPQPCAVLGWGTGEAVGDIVGAVISDDPMEFISPAVRVKFVSAGLSIINLATPTVMQLHPQDREVWARLISAIGDEGYIRRLQTLRIGIIGCGGTGSEMARALALSGARSLTLVDNDRMEPHNFGKMMVRASMGEYKVAAVAKTLQGLFAHCQIEALAESVLTRSAVAALKSCDLLICCVDNAAARLATAFLAMLYLKPLLDIGTGILASRKGADVRLILPDDSLLQVGGIRGLSEAIAQLRTDSEYNPVGNTEQIGSLPRLNQNAVTEAQGMLEAFLSGKLNDSHWLRREELSDTQITLSYPTFNHHPNDPLLALKARGDDGIREFQNFLRQLR